jgi:hypothetical protein
MSEQRSLPPKPLRRRKHLKGANTVPSCRQLAERFVQLHRLRQEVRAAESGQTVRPLAGAPSAERS